METGPSLNLDVGAGWSLTDKVQYVPGKEKQARYNVPGHSI